MKRNIIRACFVVFLILLCIVLYNAGKAHTLLPENKTVELNGTTHAAYGSITFSIDGQEDKDLYPRDRVKTEVMGRSHRIKAVGVTKTGQEVTVDKRFTTSNKQDMYLLSLPALLNGSDDWLQPFNPEN